MSLTKKERELQKEAEEIAVMANIDFWSAEREPKGHRRSFIELAISRIVVAEIITRYTHLDEILSELICHYYFPRRRERGRHKLWKNDKFRIFVNYLLDETYLIKKLDIAHAINPIAREVRSIVQKVNSLRNAMAHSFFPENRKEHRKVGKVLYKGKDIRTSDGVSAFLDDVHDAWTYLARRTYGEWDDVRQGEGKWDTKLGKPTKPEKKPIG
jgi:hypothetical protein